jgi:hypothetical protein
MLSIYGVEKYVGKAELDGAGKVELDSTVPPAEPDTFVRHAELDDVSIETSLLDGQPVGIRRAKS